MSPPILLVSYDLHPPSSTSAPPNLSTTTKHGIPLQLPNSQSDSGDSSHVYYAALRDAIAEAKDVTGRELTEWRDAIGDAEKEKTGSKGEEVVEGEEAEEAEKEDQEEVADEKE